MKRKKKVRSRGADVGAVHVGVGHNDHLVVAQLALVKLLPQAGAQGGDDGGELVVAVHLVRPGLLHVEHLAPQGEDGLVPGVPALLGGAAGGVALDDVNFRQGRVPLIAVGQLAREGGPLQGVLPADVLPGAAGGLPGPVGHHGLLQNGPAHGGVLLQIGLQLVGDHIVYQRADLAVAQLGLGLASNWASVSFTEMTQVSPPGSRRRTPCRRFSAGRSSCRRR